MTVTVGTPKVLGPDEGLLLQSGPGRDLVFKLTGEDHVLSGRFKIRIGDELHTLERRGFAYLPAGLPHAFLNLTDQPAEIIVVYTPGGCHRFYEELGPATRSATPDRAQVAAIFERHGMTLLGPPLSAA